MTIGGVSTRTSFLANQILNLQDQFADLQQQLVTHKKSTTYAGMGADRGVAIGLRAQIGTIDGYTSTMTNVNSRLDIANTALTGMVNINKQLHAAATTSPLDVTSSGQTASQTAARGSLDAMLQFLNTQAGDRFLFSGLSIDTVADRIEQCHPQWHAHASRFEAGDRGAQPGGCRRVGPSNRPVDF